MILINQSVNLIKSDGINAVKACEFAGRNCYASQDKITDNSYERFANNLLLRHHETPLEFSDLTFDITTSRAVMAELTRHRLANFCIESQRYIQEAKTGDITFIKPVWYDEKYFIKILSEENNSPEALMCCEWRKQMLIAENSYKNLIQYGAKPEEAREVLPNSTACRIIMKANLREWRHIFELRCSPAAYPQMREITKQMLKLAHNSVPIVFDDLYNNFIEKHLEGDNEQ